jgi:DNA-binding NtrC family response regulator
MPSRLLIIDNNPDTVLAVHNALQATYSDALIVTAASAESALVHMNSYDTFDIVLSDIRMLGMHGLVLLREIKARFPECIVVFMTGAEKSLRADALRLGAFAFLEKPLDLHQLGLLLSGSMDHAQLPSADHRHISVGCQ